ncbi:MAG: glycoside hydrolase family 13 protein [Ignavibacteriaceae bacterium]
MKTLLLLFLLVNFPGFIFSQNHFPDWAKGIVWYQIFPERFANGDESNDPDAAKVFINSSKVPAGWDVKEWTANWFEPSDWEKGPDGRIKDIYDRRYGGDIQGIINKLDYIKELGAGAIYLNPVFEAVSLHKYDGSTYHHIDINFGPDPGGDNKLMESETPDKPSTWQWTEADKLFLKLIDETHKRGMKIIIDGVFNHTGTQFWAFRDVVKNGSESKYKEWYRINSFDDPATEKDEFDYKGWWDIKSLPEINRTENDLHPAPKQYIFHSTQRWMDPNNDGDPEDGIDGWRLDVAREVPLDFWHDWSRLVKSINNKAIIIGELWELSPDFISKNGAFDALMNYNFAYAVDSLFIQKKISVSKFIEKLEEINKTYPYENIDILQNLMDSHDTERLSSRILNPGRAFDRDANEGNPDYNPGKPSKKEFAIQKLILAFMMTCRGAPMIYYGDEIGMWGADDPHVRKPMVWDELKYDNEVITASSGFKKGFGTYKVEQDKDLLEFYKKIISIRNKSNALREGSLNFLYKNDDKNSFVFERLFENEHVIVSFNIGNEPEEIDIPVNKSKIAYSELISGETGSAAGVNKSLLNIKMEPGTVKIFKIY